MEHKINKYEWEERFWREFPIPYQEEDPEVNFANVSDAARALVKSRNWSATIGSTLSDLTRRIAECKSEIAERTTVVSKLEGKVLARNDLPSSVTKNKEAQRAYARKQADTAELRLIHENEDTLTNLHSQLILLQGNYESVESMRRALEKSSDWLVQFVNWHKFEARMIE